MVRTGILFLLLSSLTFVLPIQKLCPAPLSPEAKVSLLTCSPGTETYSLFGHSAIRVHDPAQGFDLVFNYGTFDFNTPNFYMKFVKGRLNYMLSVSTYEQFLREYIIENRSVYEQELLIPHTSKETLFNNLLENYRPENRYYLYDFFFDNCATRVRDIIETSIEAPVEYDYSDYQEIRTLRQLLDPYLDVSPWLDVGVDLAMGLAADKKASPHEYMFLPDYIMNIFDKAMIDSADYSRSLCSNFVIVFKADPELSDPSPFTPHRVFWALFLGALAVTFIEFRKKESWLWFDRILLLVLGLLGTFFVLLWIGSDHEPLKANLNLLWALPLHLAAVFFLRKRGNPSFPGIYFLITSIPVLALIMAQPWIHHMMPRSVLPLLLMVFIRLLMLSPARDWLNHRKS